MFKLYNSLSRKIEEFKPIKSKKVGLYTCGPTVYDYAHIGNLRAYIFGDILKRVLDYNGYKIQHVMNITDVDDKTIKKSQEEKKPLPQVTEFFTEKFLEDLKDLNILPPDKLVRATSEISGMIEMVKVLLDKGFAYQTKEGDVYFSIAKLPDYGKLANISKQELKTNAEGRLSDADEYDKENIHDFALWRAHDSSDKDVFWESPFGKGRPGWHIECSVMSSKYLGQPFDIHAGGVDLIFPHHTNEIAQSEAANGKPLANYWIHFEHLLVDGKKMAKSAKNFFKLADITDKEFAPLAFRYLLLTTHYRSKVNFTWESLTAAQNALNNLYEQISAFEPAAVGCAEYEQNFLDAINDDLDTPKALAIVWDLVRSDYPGSAKLQSLIKFDQVLGLRIKEVWEEAKAIPESVQKLVKQRETARETKDFAKADELRKKIESNGYLVEDTETGFRLKKKYT
ncbi:MAG: cysteine--tRNA ligase [Candidatus Doudnabacteria bacterium]|nr:cysteine--tRNA ligase [Candidatus Doudnabacteria bacterium]